MSATYPGGVYSPRTKANAPGIAYDAAKTTRLYAEDVVKDDDEIVAIETELGTNCKGSATSVRARIEAIEAVPARIEIYTANLDITTNSLALIIPAKAGQVFLLKYIILFNTSLSGETNDVRYNIGYTGPDYADYVEHFTIPGESDTLREYGVFSTPAVLPTNTDIYAYIDTPSAAGTGVVKVVIEGYYMTP